jgi:hypothetical protein
MCSQGPEDIEHLFFQCAMTQGMWNALGLSRAELVVREVLLRRDDSELHNFDNIGLKEVILVT